VWVAPLVAVVRTPPAGLLRLAVERQRRPEMLQQVEPHSAAKHRQPAFRTPRRMPVRRPTQFLQNPAIEISLGLSVDVA
jgi:hypothetical protein